MGPQSPLLQILRWWLHAGRDKPRKLKTTVTLLHGMISFESASVSSKAVCCGSDFLLGEKAGHKHTAPNFFPEELASFATLYEEVRA